MVPHVVLGIAFLRFFTQVGLGRHLHRPGARHVIVVMPFALRLVLAASYGSTRASTCGGRRSAPAGDGVPARHLPLILPGVVSGWMLAFINSFDEVDDDGLRRLPATVTLPVRMFLYIQDNIDPLIASVSACLIALTALMLVALDRIFGLDRLFVGAGKG